MLVLYIRDERATGATVPFASHLIRHCIERLISLHKLNGYVKHFHFFMRERICHVSLPVRLGRPV